MERKPRGSGFRHGWIQVVNHPPCHSQPASSYLSSVSTISWSHFCLFVLFLFFLLLYIAFLHATKAINGHKQFSNSRGKWAFLFPIPMCHFEKGSDTHGSWPCPWDPCFLPGRWGTMIVAKIGSKVGKVPGPIAPQHPYWIWEGHWSYKRTWVPQEAHAAGQTDITKAQARQLDLHSPPPKPSLTPTSCISLLFLLHSSLPMRYQCC